jgi:hypothetical protein
VIACNNDGVWNDAGAMLDFSIAPAWYQTNWFRILCVVFGVLIVVVVYRLRVRQIARSIGARFDERLAQRTRMARDIHDTFLQTIQGSKRVADRALKPSTDSCPDARCPGTAISLAWTSPAGGTCSAEFTAHRDGADKRPR